MEAKSPECSQPEESIVEEVAYKGLERGKKRKKRKKEEKREKFEVILLFSRSSNLSLNCNLERSIHRLHRGELLILSQDLKLIFFILKYEKLFKEKEYLPIILTSK